MKNEKKIEMLEELVGHLEQAAFVASQIAPNWEDGRVQTLYKLFQDVQNELEELEEI